MKVEYTVAHRIALVTIANPPVNALSLAVRRGLLGAFERARADPAIDAIVLRGVGKGFCAGADISELGTPNAAAPPGLSQHVHVAIERCGKPVVAALHGFAVGGGLETALACHARVAQAATRIALPEIGLGLIPLSGTQRLPRLVGIERSAAMILGGQRHTAAEMRESGLFDLVAPDAIGELEHHARELAKALASGSRPLRLARDRPLPDDDPHAALAAARARWVRDAATPALHGAIEALQAAVECLNDFDAGMDRARAIYDRLTAERARSA